MILRRTNDNYAKKSLRIWSTVKVSWVRRCSRRVGISGVISPFKSQNLSCWDFNLSLDYFYDIGFRLSAHWKLTLKSGD